LIVVTFGATILIDISVKNRREKTIVDEKWKHSIFPPMDIDAGKINHLNLFFLVRNKSFE
jgi:hypothetical protein